MWRVPGLPTGWEMGNQIRVSVVDDDAVVRSTLRLIIERLEGFHVASLHAGAEDALEVLPGVAPDVVLVDIRMPGMSGIDCARRLNELLPDTRIVMVTAHVDDDAIASALRAGAVGYVAKPFAPATIAQALNDAVSGVIRLEGEVAARFSTAMRERRPKPKVALSDREVAILSHAREGLSDKEIADRLSVSVSTVKSHMRRVFGKLKAHSRSGAISAYFDPS